MTAFKSVEEAKGFVSFMKALYGGVDIACEKGVKATALDGKTVSCKKGCAHCCHILAFATVPEAIFALAFAEQKGIDIEALKPAILDGTAESLMPDMSLTKWFTEKRRPCPFLDADDTCAIYMARPLPCRVYFVVSDAAHCAWDHPTGDTRFLSTIHLQVPGIKMLMATAEELGLASVGLGTWPMCLRVALAFQEAGALAANACMAAMRMDNLAVAHARLEQIRHGKSQIIRLPEEKREALIIDITKARRK